MGVADDFFGDAAEKDVLKTGVAVGGGDDEVYLIGTGQLCDFVKGLAVAHERLHNQIVLRLSSCDSGQIPFRQFEYFQVITHKKCCFRPGEVR